MKICISATGNNLDAFLDPRFGRAVYFLIVDDKGKLIKAIKNTGTQAMRGAGSSAAQIVVNEKVEIMITGNIGPNAFTALNLSGTNIFIASPGMTVRNVFKEYQKGKLQKASNAIPGQAGFGPGFGERGRGPGTGRRRRL